MVRLVEIKAIGCNWPSNSWESIITTAKLEASISAMKGLLLSGFFKIGAEVKSSFNLSKDFCFSEPQRNGTFLLVSLCKGRAILIKSLIKIQ